jgi:RND superfamily putative drug exporter
MPHRLHALASTLAAHWKRSALAAVLAFVAIAALGAAAGGALQNSFAVPGTESQKAVDLLQSRFPAAAGDTATIVFSVDDGTLRDGGRAQAIAGTVRAIGAQPHVSAATNPLAARAQGQVSRDGRIAFSTVQYNRPGIDIPDAGSRLKSAARLAERDGVHVAMRGSVVDQANQESAPVGELIGIFLAVVLLTALFRSLAAMAVTLIGAFVGVGVGVLILHLVAGAVTLPTFAPTLGLMLGLGAGIDYALLIVGRYREQRALGDDAPAAAGKANGAAGMSVLAAGVIVIVAISGLLAAGIPFVGAIGLGAAIVVAGVVLSALTVLPIALGAFGKRLAPKKAEHADGSAGFARWGESITRHPVVATLVGLLILGGLALPATGMKLGMPDDSTKAPGTTQRVAYDKLTEAFGPGFNGPLLLAVKLPPDKAKAQDAIKRIPAAIASTPGVRGASPAIPNAHGDEAIITATPTTSPQDPRTSHLINHLRDRVLPAATKGTGATVYVGGATATFMDMSDKIASRLPVFIGAVVIVSLLLLMAAFRSVWVPLVSAAFNLLAIAAAYGAVTAVFNDGFGMSLIGLKETIPTVSFVPLMMFAILFGLSMDYNVFLLSRIREAYQEGDTPKRSVVHGMSRIAKVILVAGTIMACVFAGFMLTPDAIIKQMGFGLAVAILIDVLVVRMLVAPAVVTLLGKHAWTLPRWLDRILPAVHLEGEEQDRIEPDADIGVSVDQPAGATA